MTPEYRVVSYILLPFTLILFIGLIIIKSGNIKPGLKLILIGSIGYFPLGLVSLVGCNRTLDQIQREELGID